VIGVFTIVSGLLALWLPETLGFPMHQTIQEAEEAKESYAMIWRCPWKKESFPVTVNDGDHPDEPIMTTVA